MLRLLAAKFSKSVSVPAERVEWILADTDNVEPGKIEVLVSNASSQQGWIICKLRKCKKYFSSQALRG